MLRMARLWTRAWIAGTMTLVTSLLFSPLPTASAQQAAPAPPAAPGAKPSKERFTNAMERLREQRRTEPNRSKSASASNKTTPSKREAAKRAKRKRDRDAKRRASKRSEDQQKERPVRGKGQRIDLTAPSQKTVATEKTPKRASEVNNEAPTRPKVRRPAPALPEPHFTELEKALKQSLQLKIVDLGPDERWRVTLENRGTSPVEIAADPRLVSFQAHVPGKVQPVRCQLPEALLPRPNQVRRRTLPPGEQYSFSIDPLMYCFETGDQTILVPGTFLTPAYGFPEKTKTRWSWGRKYEERLEQVAPFFASYLTRDQMPPVGPPPMEDSNADDASGNAAETEETKRSDAATRASSSAKGLKQLVGEGFALRSEYQGWAKARASRFSLGDRPQRELKLSISAGSDAPNARNVSVTVKLENQSETPQRVYFRRDLVSFVIQGPDGEHECSPSTSAELRAPDPQAFTTIAPGKSASFTTQLLELCPAASFARPGFYYVSAVLPSTSPTGYPDEDVFTGKLAASKPRPVRLHKAELPFLLRRGSGGGSAPAGGSNSGRFTRSPATNMVPEGEMIAPLPAPPPEAPAPVEAPPPPPPPQ